MFRTKKHVDQHVHEVLRKFPKESERNLRCFNIAQLYYKVRDYDSAKNYLSMYLSVKGDSPQAYKLQGQIWEGLGDKIKALNAYKTSLEYDANQPGLVHKMCQLLCETDIALDKDSASYWCEEGARLFPHDTEVFRLKEKLLKLGGQANAQAFEELINSEVKARPNDVSVRTKLMQLYLETGRTKAAFNHALELETDENFTRELPWYECFAQICRSYAEEFPSLVDWKLYCTWVSVLDKVTSLCLSEVAYQKKIVDCINAIFCMDQTLFKAAAIVAPKENTELYNHFLRHMSSQLCLHIATLIFKRAKKEPCNWIEATRSVSPLLFLALSSPLDTDAPWCLTLAPRPRQWVTTWANDAWYRVSQAGHLLLVLSSNAGKQFTETVIHHASANWREKTYQRVFMALEHRTGISTSHFVHSNLLAKVSVRLPSHDSAILQISHLVPVYEKVRGTLHHLVWLGLEAIKHNDKKLPPSFHTYSFTRLKFTTHDLANMSPETLSVLDVDAFLYATVLCAAGNLEEEILNGFYLNDRPTTMPADISHLLCTQEQMNWWSSVCEVNNQCFGRNKNMVVLRQQLQSGLEVVRVDSNHGLDVLLVVKLARTFADRAVSVSGRKEDQAALETRALMYWTAALPLLEKMERQQTVRVYNTKLFEYYRKELSMAEVSSLLEEGRYFTACQHMKSEQYERAIEFFRPLRSPYASFNMALIYKKLAAAQLEERPREEITSEDRSKHVILLSKARECLNQTWERIRIDRRHPLHDTLPEHISEVETALSRIEPDPETVNRSEGDINLSERSLSSVGSQGAGDMGMLSPKLNGRVYKHSNTPRSARYHHNSDKRHNYNGEFINVGQLLQVQSLHDEIKKLHEKLEQVIVTVKDIRRDVNKIKPSGAEEFSFFGEDEEFPEDVLNGQYPPTFVQSYPTVAQSTPTYYPTPTRGVQCTSTVTYGAPPQQTPVIPLLPMRVPLDPVLAGYQSQQNLAFYNQATLPFADPQHIPDFLRQSIPKPVLSQQPPPVNVVITTSDTLPIGPPPVQPTLSVTIPPQHRLGTLPMSTLPTNATISTPPHNFQIPMPATAIVPSLEKSPIVIPDEVDSEDDNEVTYDPCPDFRPIIPLPNEVRVTTGEENEDALFENRAKLFRYVEKEWKERGVGVVKILRNRTTNKVRLLMRRDQVHKICANHLITSDMEITMMKNSDRALLWGANDFSEEVVNVEKFCMKFKTSDEAIKFKDAFNDAKMKYGQSPPRTVQDKESKKSEPITKVSEEVKPVSSAKVNLGGFTFTSTPKLKDPINDTTNVQEDKKKDSQVGSSPFAAFSFNTPNKSKNILKPPTLTTPLFAGLDSTQNKHTLFDDSNESSHSESSFDSNSSSKVPNDFSPKTDVKESDPTSFQVSSLSSNPINDKQNNDISSKQNENDPSMAKTKPTFNFSFKPQPISSTDSPKSILKEPVLANFNPKVTTSPSPGKHVFFQDSVGSTGSPKNQSPTLAALLTSPTTEVIDFAALSKKCEGKPLEMSTNKASVGFEGAGSTVFGNRARNDSEGDNAEEFVPSAEFKPVIPLPELVEIKTGEESEEVLFNERAKLMRFESGSKEWKERGLGQMKILKNTITGVTRFLMRREQVYKVCCNHRITQSLELKPSPSSEKAYTWYAVDYSEGEMKNELLAIRFKTVDLAKLFKERVDEVQKQLREENLPKRSFPDSAVEDVPKNSADNLPKLSELFRPKTGSWECKACYTVNGSKDNKCVSCDTPKEKPKSPGPASPLPLSKEKTQASLSELFKPKTGSWECAECLVRNDGDKTSCLACCTPKPGHEKDSKESPKTSSPFNFSFKSDAKDTGFCFGIQNNESSSTPKSSFTFGFPAAKATDNKFPGSNGKIEPSEDKSGHTNILSGTGFTFGQNSINKAVTPFSFSSKGDVVPSFADSTTPAKVEESKPQGTMFKFGTPSTPSKASFTFGTPSSSSTSTEANQFAFGKESNFEFNFSGVVARSPGSGGKSPRSPGAEDDSGLEELDEGEGDHIIFQPIVPLPDKVPLTTGEEQEDVLYSHRAKLYRFAAGEWKERGVGDIKLLQHKDTHKIRLLMRREPILKICLNHYLTTELSFNPKDDRSWHWFAPDFAEGQLVNEQFCLRFKTPSVAADFKRAVDMAQGELSSDNNSEKVPTGHAVEPSSSGEVEVLYEAKVSDELREMALKLQLPPNFYSYLDAPPCPGCAGCELDNEIDEVNESTSAKTGISKEQTSVPASVDKSPFSFSVNTKTPSSLLTTSTAVQPNSVKPPVEKTGSSTEFGVQQQTNTSSLFGGVKSIKTIDDAFLKSSPSVKPFAPSFFNSTKAAATSVITTSTTQSTTSTFSTPLSSTPTSIQSSFTFSFNAPTPPTETRTGFGFQLPTNTSSKTKSVDDNRQTPRKVGTDLLFGTTGSTQSATTLSFGNTQESLVNSPNEKENASVTAQSTPNLFSTPTNTSSSKNSSFLSDFQSPQNSMFGGSSPVSQGPFFKSPFTQSETPKFGMFGSVSESTNSAPSFLFKPTTTFSDLAATNKQSSFVTDQTSTKFSWQGAGTSVFAEKKSSTKTKDEESGGESGGEEGDTEATHDPVFEPIVPLPDAIEVRTGEEEEDIEFCNRAKFYRYDTDLKEWKERGVGDLKILRHREMSTYRLLLRREQVHKVVCNQLINPEMDLQELASSDRAFCWAGMNMAEEYSEPRLEKVAVRFKNPETAREFKMKIEETITQVKAIKEKANTQVLELSSDLLEPHVTVEEVGAEYSEGDDEVYCVEGEEYLEDEDESEVLFEKIVTLYVRDHRGGWAKVSQGQLNVNYHSQVNASTISFKADDGNYLQITPDHNTEVLMSGEKATTWHGSHFNMNNEDSSLEVQEYKAEFSYNQDAEDFVTVLSEVMELSQTYGSVLDSEAED